jgi:hypothetical protein
MRRLTTRTMAAALIALVSATASAQSTGGQSQAPPPAPRPFPGAPAPPTSTGAKPADPSTTAAKPQSAPTPAELGQAIIYPSAEFLESVDAGRGQRLLLYGTNMSYEQIVTYYKARRLENRELFQEPPMHQFDLGRFNEQVMVYPPSIVVKDYTWNGSEGYLHVSGTTEKRYRTIIQITPAGPTIGR